MLCFSCRKSNQGLELRAPGNHSRTNLDHISTSGPAIVRVSTMISIRISDERLRWSRGLVDELLVHSTLQITKHMLCSLPVSQSRIGVESGKNSGSIGNVWTSGDCQIHQRANHRDIRVLAHF